MIKNLPLYFLVSFGHCGIDYLHSLLDSHDQLLIMPTFSFYRSWKRLGCEEVKDPYKMFSIWQTYVEEDPGMQFITRKLFYEKNQKNLFYARFRELLLKSGEINRVNVCYALHEAYSFARNIDLSQVRAIVIHEHLSFYVRQILTDFPHAHILQIIRDPRASLAGTLRGMGKALGCLPDFNFNLITEYWIEAYENWKNFGPKIGKRYRVVRNEDLHASLEHEMRKVADWMGIDFSPTLMMSTFSGKHWEGESSYMTADNKYPQPEEEFFRPENVKARWMKELSFKEIVMIEFFTRKSMKEFGYDRITGDNLFWRIYGFIIYTLPHRRLFKKWLELYPRLDEFDRVYQQLNSAVLKKIWKYLPNPLKFVNVIMHSITRRVMGTYFFPYNRAQRYF